MSTHRSSIQHIVHLVYRSIPQSNMSCCPIETCFLFTILNVLPSELQTKFIFYVSKCQPLLFRCRKLFVNFIETFLCILLTPFHMDVSRRFFRLGCYTKQIIEFINRHKSYIMIWLFIWMRVMLITPREILFHPHPIIPSNMTLFWHSSVGCVLRWDSEDFKTHQKFNSWVEHLNKLGIPDNSSLK